jgi:hypothetical protein
MFNFNEYDKKFQDLAKQVKQVNDFWVDAIVTTLKMFTK